LDLISAVVERVSQQIVTVQPDSGKATGFAFDRSGLAPRDRVTVRLKPSLRSLADQDTAALSGTVGKVRHSNIAMGACPPEMFQTQKCIMFTIPNMPALHHVWPVHICAEGRKHKPHRENPMLLSRQMPCPGSLPGSSDPGSHLGDGKETLEG